MNKMKFLRLPVLILIITVTNCRPAENDPLTGRWKFADFKTPESPDGMQAELFNYHMIEYKSIVDSIGRPLTAEDTSRVSALVKKALEAQIANAFAEFNKDKSFIWQVTENEITKGHYTINRDSSLVSLTTEEEITRGEKNKLSRIEKFNMIFLGDTLLLKSEEYAESFYLVKSPRK